mmetsp:Transcript_24725/g.39871  ORF Transcript_24725/g.39871 Transcript_24725/m.39871 type:complete len:211 (+) Transcript_24725:935-1567(+)
MNIMAPTARSLCSACTSRLISRTTPQNGCCPACRTRFLQKYCWARNRGEVWVRGKLGRRSFLASRRGSRLKASNWCASPTWPCSTCRESLYTTFRLMERRCPAPVLKRRVLLLLRSQAGWDLVRFPLQGPRRKTCADRLNFDIFHMLARTRVLRNGGALRVPILATCTPLLCSVSLFALGSVRCMWNTETVSRPLRANIILIETGAGCGT